METPQTHTQETKTDDEILGSAAETARQVGAVAERAVYVLDKSGTFMLPKERDDVLARRSVDVQ
ncbi:MAG: hypothetical protein ABIQ64_01090 [Candidatus Saccharimonadales bacterium]